MEPGNYGWFVAARTITGIAIGADLAVVNTYINEMAPREERARYTSLIFFFSSLGAVAGIWLGLRLTTPPTPLPVGSPFPGVLPPRATSRSVSPAGLANRRQGRAAGRARRPW
jgi:MFS family permease